MNLAAWSLKSRAIVTTMVALVMLWGAFSFMTMPRREDPAYTVRTCAVTTSWPGASAEKIEELITKPLEEIIDQIEQVDVVRSTTTVGLSTVYVDAEDALPADQIPNVWDLVRGRIKKAVMPEPWIVPYVNDEYGDTSILLLAVHQVPLPGEDKIREERRYTLRELDILSEEIKDELRLIEGVSKSEQYGVVEEAIYVETSMETWSQLGLTTDGIDQLVTARNIVAAGGSIDTENERYTVKPGGEFDTVSEIDSVIAGLVDRRPVYLKDLGLRVVRDYDDPRKIICRHGDTSGTEPAVMVALTMKKGANIVDICNAAKKRVSEMRDVEKRLPPDLAADPVSDMSENVTAKINQVASNVVGAIVIVVIVVYLLVGFRSAMVMAANIPVVVLGSIALITLFGVELEQMSLASIIIALGLLVDNAVQVCDQARVNQMNGMPPVEAAVQGSNSLSSPMLMGTATTIAAFAPMIFCLLGSRQEYIFSLPLTLTVTLALSWVLAMSFCTILAAKFIRGPKDPSKPSAPLPWIAAKLGGLLRKGPPRADGGVIMSTCGAVIGGAIKLRFVTIAVAVACLVGAMALPVSSEYFPKDLRDQFAIEIWTPANSSIEATDAAARQVEDIIRKLSPTTDAEGQSVERLREMRTMVGGGGCRWYLSWDPEPRVPYFAEILVRTTDGRLTPEYVKRVREVAERGDAELGIDPVAGARVVPRELFMGPGADPVEIRVLGPGFADIKTLRYFAARVKDLIRADGGAWDVNDSWGVPGNQIRVEVDEDKASLAGITNESIAQTLNAYFSGHLLTTFKEGDHTVPVYLRLKPDGRTLQELDGAFVEGVHGKVPLNSVARVDFGWDPARIVRRNLNRVIEVRSQTEPGVQGNDVVLGIMASDEMKQLQEDMPSGYRVEVGGTLEESEDGKAEIGSSFLISFLVIVLLLVIQYNGWAKPLMILSTLPLALAGAIPGLYLTGNPMGFMPQLGVLALFGIVLNTGIIFIEFADLLIAERARKSDGSGPICGLTKQEFRSCLVDAAKLRLMPIFLTTSTTIAGLVPLALAGGPLWEGLSWCMIFGLIVATLLTLLVVPALYAIFVEVFRIKPVRL